MMSCEEFTQKVGDYLEGRVPMGDRMGMWLHEILCKPCRWYRKQMELVVDLTGDLSEEQPPEKPPESTRDELLAKFRDKHSDCDH